MRGVRYDRMTPEQQREYDETDLAIMRMVDDGASYSQIRSALGVTPKRIVSVKRMIIEDDDL